VEATIPSADERAAMRAFLQRCEVRLSTMHRVATALLSGAGILVLLPALERDSVVQVMRVLLVGPISVSRGLEALAIALSIGLALTALWMVIMELTRFYFHANHVEHEHGEVFTPRFTLTGLRIATDELSPETDTTYRSVHASTKDVRLLIAANDRARARIDRQLAAYPGLVERQAGDGDGARAEALFELAASRRRTMVEDVSKIEYGMVRHMLRLQVIILRYVKALLVILATSLAAFVCAAAIEPGAPISAAGERWIAGTMALWAPIAIIVVSSPVRWLERLLRTEGAEHTAVRNDAELTQVERLTTWFAIATWVAAATATVTLLVDHPITDQGRVATIGALVVSTGLLAYALLRGRLARS
jgi:hypothetical protein